MPSLDDILITDDFGREYVAMGGSSGGDGSRWTFQSHLRPPISQDTTALRFQVEDQPAVRVELTPPPAGIEVGPVEDLPDDERWCPAERFLLETAERSFNWWRRAVTHGGRPAPPVDDTAVEALVATGAIDPDSPAISMRRALAQTQPGEQPPSGLPPRWASVLANLEADDGHVATAVMGAALPLLADREVWLDAVTSEPDSWRLHAFLRPGTWETGRGPWISEPAFSASDDRGGFYTGVMDGAGGGGDGLSMTLRFVPRLDPLARVLTLHATAKDRRVTVTVPLPHPWGGLT